MPQRKLKRHVSGAASISEQPATWVVQSANNSRITFSIVPCCHAAIADPVTNEAVRVLHARCRTLNNEVVIGRHFGICGGCSIQDLQYAQQLASKEAALRKLLKPVLRQIEGSIASPLFTSVESDE